MSEQIDAIKQALLQASMTLADEATAWTKVPVKNRAEQNERSAALEGKRRHIVQVKQLDKRLDHLNRLSRTQPEIVARALNVYMGKSTAEDEIAKCTNPALLRQELAALDNKPVGTKRDLLTGKEVSVNPWAAASAAFNAGQTKDDHAEMEAFDAVVDEFVGETDNRRYDPVTDALLANEDDNT